MPERLGVFFCRCLQNISGAIDLDGLMAGTRELPSSPVVHGHDFLCSLEGKQEMAAVIRDAGLTRVVVAACSPREHEADFQEGLELGGLDPAMLQVANLREHGTWVTRDPALAQAKCRALVQGAIARVLHHVPVEREEIDCNPDALVVGGGIAGMEAALLLAQAGRRVTLVEAAPSLGGRIVEMDDVAPDLECSSCLVAPRLSAIADHPQVTILTQSRLAQVRGFLGSFSVKIARTARLVSVERCIGCDACIQACPVPVSSPGRPGQSKAIYLPFPGCVPSCATIDRAACLRFRGEGCQRCQEACPAQAVDFAQPDDEVEVTVGALVLATGAEPLDPGSIPLGQGPHPDVYTLAQFEAMSNPSGPTRGQIRKRDGDPPRRIAVIHCAGRAELGYCSSYCCQAALKVGLIGLKRFARDGVTPSPEICHLHTDLVLHGPRGEALLARARQQGVRLIPVASTQAIRLGAERGSPRVGYTDLGGHDAWIEPDMVVLAMGLAPGRDSAALAGMLSLKRDGAGFIAEDHPLLRPAQTSVEGIYLAGCAGGARDIQGSILAAQAAAGCALSRIQPGRKITLKTQVASIDPDRCSRCLVCVGTCPYLALEHDPARDAVRSNPVLCQGCGQCAAACGSGAIDAKQFTDRQLRSEIEGVLDG